MALPPLCLLCVTCSLQQLWSFKEGTGVVLQQLHRNRTFWIWATTERPSNFVVAQRWHEGRSSVYRGLKDISVRPASVCLSVHPSVCYIFFTTFLSSYHHEIFRSHYQCQKWCPCKRSKSKVKVTKVTTQSSRFRTVTPAWIQLLWWNDAQSLMLLRTGVLFFFKVIRQFSRSDGTKIADFDSNWAFPDCNSSLNSPMAWKWCTKLEVA